MKLIIDIPQKVNEHIRSWYGHSYFPQNGEDRNIIAKAIYDATLIPDNATNGEVLKAMFDTTEEHFYDEDRMVDVYGLDRTDEPSTFYADWWNASYQKEV